jgi:hypothetical protein
MPKKSFLIVILLISPLMIISCQHDLDKGLVVYYPFTAGVYDQSGHSQNGIVDGAVLTEDRIGNKNCAYNFDGIEATILVNMTQIPALQEAQSISWWYVIDSIPRFSDEWGAGNMIALVDTTRGIGIQFGFRGPAYKSLGLDVWNWGGGTILECQPPTVKVWHHCVYTFDGKVHQLFIDGQMKARSTIKTQQGVPTLLMFGNYPSGDQFFTGALDEIRIYDRVISLAEIQQLSQYDR